MSDQLTNDLRSSFKELLTLITSVDEPKFNQIPFSGSWTIGQVGDHLFKSYDAVNVLKGTTEKTSRPVDEKVAMIKTIFLDFGTKLQSPDFIIPENGPIEKERLIRGLEKRTKAIVDVAQNEDLSLLCLDFEMPQSGHLTRLEWISFIYFHTLRHIHQLKNIISKLN